MDITVCTTLVTPPPPPPVEVPVINMTLSVTEAMLLQVILNKIGGSPDRVRAVAEEMRERLAEVLGGVYTYHYGVGSIHFHGTVEDFNNRFGVADVEARLLRSNRS